MSWRLRVFVFRFVDYLIHIPLRLLRFVKWMLWLVPLKGDHRWWRWLAGFLLLALDITPLPLCYETLSDFIKLKTRSLNQKEKEIAAWLLGPTFPFHLVGTDPSSIPARMKEIAYVSFHTIHFHHHIPDAIFAHELVHIWQYRRFGSVYISES